eukprot:6874-Heterococcus_DN1.PRE.1
MQRSMVARCALDGNSSPVEWRPMELMAAKHCKLKPKAPKLQLACYCVGAVVYCTAPSANTASPPSTT